MASGCLNRIESAFAEAALDSGRWSRPLHIETGSFGVTVLPVGGVSIISGVGGVVGPADVCAGLSVAPGAALLNRAPVRESMPFDMRPPTPSRGKTISRDESIGHECLRGENQCKPYPCRK